MPGSTGAVTLVLVHGGTVDSRMWDGVLPHLHAPALAVDLPGRRYRPHDLSRVTRSTWVEAVRDDIIANDLEGVVLVGHSSGGYVIPGVAALLPERVRHLVFVAATVPADTRKPVEYLKPKLKELAVGSEDAVRQMARGKTLGGLRPGEPAIDTELEIVENEGRMGLEAPGPLHEPFTWDGVPRQIPRTYIRCLLDRVIPPELADQMIRNMGGARVVDIDAPHEVAIDRPEDLAAVLNDIARRSENETFQQGA